jgi:hypothetical protein
VSSTPSSFAIFCNSSLERPSMLSVDMMVHITPQYHQITLWFNIQHDLISADRFKCESHITCALDTTENRKNAECTTSNLCYTKFFLSLPYVSSIFDLHEGSNQENHYHLLVSNTLEILYAGSKPRSCCYHFLGTLCYRSLIHDRNHVSSATISTHLSRLPLHSRVTTSFPRPSTQRVSPCTVVRCYHILSRWLGIVEEEESVGISGFDAGWDWKTFTVYITKTEQGRRQAVWSRGIEKDILPYALSNE